MKFALAHLLSIFAVSVAYATPPCESILTSDRNLGRARFEQALMAEAQKERTGQLPPLEVPQSTVSLEGVFKGPDGGRVFLAARNPSQRWYGVHANIRVGRVSIDVQGDPRSGILVLGYDLARVLGMRPVDHRRILLGDAHEISEGLIRFNNYLAHRGIDPIPVQFYSPVQGTDVVAVLEDYLRNYAEHFALPIAEAESEWNHFLHDMSFHSPFVLATPEVLKKHRELVAAQVKFLDFARSELSKQLPPHLARIAYRALVFDFATELDVFTGRLFQIGSLLLQDFSRAERPIVPGRRASPLMEKKELAAYMTELTRTFFIPRSDPRSDPDHPIPTLAINALSELVGFVSRNMTDPTNDYTRYLLGPGARKFQAEDYMRIHWALLNAFTEFAVSTRDDEAFDRPLFSGERELRRVATSLIFRRKQLQRAARDYWATQR